MLEDIDVANINLRRMEKELLAARLTLWDQFFIACLPVAFRSVYGHHGKIAGVAAAAEMADEAMRVREIKNAAAHGAKVRVDRSVMQQTTRKQ